MITTSEYLPPNIGFDTAENGERTVKVWDKKPRIGNWYTYLTEGLYV